MLREVACVWTSRIRIFSLQMRLYRDDRTFKNWRKPFLEDETNLALTQPSVFDKWQEENSKIEDETLRACDISGLPSYLKKRTLTKPVFESPDHIRDCSFDRQRKIFGIYGKEHVEPTSCWPDKKEFERLEFLQTYLETPLEESLETIAERKKVEAEEIEARMESIEKNMERLPMAMEQFEKRQLKKEEDNRQRLQRRKEMMEEAREFFGFHLNPGDDKLRQMEMLKEEEKKLKKKELRKKELGLL